MSQLLRLKFSRLREKYLNWCTKFMSTPKAYNGYGFNQMGALNTGPIADVCAAENVVKVTVM